MIEVRVDGGCHLVINGVERPCEPGVLASYGGSTLWFPASRWQRARGSGRTVTLHGPNDARIVLDTQAMTIEELAREEDQFVLRSLPALPPYPR